MASGGGFWYKVSFMMSSQLDVQLRAYLSNGNTFNSLVVRAQILCNSMVREETNGIVIISQTSDTMPGLALNSGVCSQPNLG